MTEERQNNVPKQSESICDEARYMNSDGYGAVEDFQELRYQIREKL